MGERAGEKVDESLGKKNHRTYFTAKKKKKRGSFHLSDNGSLPEEHLALFLGWGGKYHQP